MSTLLSNTIKPASGDTVTFADCNVSVGGTLTSEDVTSVDSVGLITARSGIEVSGIVTATSFSGDGSNLTNIESGVVNFVASGTIDNGKTVIIKDDGTVGIVTMVGSDAPSVGTPVLFRGTNSQDISTVYDSTTDKIVIFYRDNDDADIGKAVVGTVSGTSIGFGSVTEFSYSSYNIKGVSMGGGKVVITYKDSTNVKGQAKVGTISTGNPGSFPNDGRIWSAAPHTNFVESSFWKAFDDAVVGNYAETTATDDIGSMTFDPSIPISSITSFKVSSVSNTTLSQNWGFNGGSLTARVCNGPTEMLDLLPGSGNLTSMEVQKTGSGVAAVNEILINNQRLVNGANGPSVSFGSSSEFVSGVSGFDYTSAGYAGTDTVAIAYRDASNSYHGYVVIGSVDTSANTITFGTPVNIGLFNTEWTSTTYDTWNDKLIVTYRNSGSNDRGEVIAGDVSGVGVTFGPAAPTQFAPSVSGGIVVTSTTFDSTNGKIVIAFRDGATPYPGLAMVGFVTTNNAVSLGSSVEFVSATASNNFDNIYDSTNNRVCITYQGTDTYGKIIMGTVSGDTISFGSTVEYSSSFTNEQSSAYDSTNDNVVIAYSDADNSYHGTTVVFSPTSSTTNLTSENYIGIAAETISDTSTGKINVIGGVNSGQSGLTTAKTYYVGQSGILTTTADTPSVVAGTSMSSTKIKVR